MLCLDMGTRCGILTGRVEGQAGVDDSRREGFPEARMTRGWLPSWRICHRDADGRILNLTVAEIAGERATPGP